MPVIKSAIKKLRQDKKREEQNDKLRNSMKSAMRAAKKGKSGKLVAKAITIVDKAAKNNIIHKNKASRLKSSLTKLAKPISVKNILPKTKPSVKTAKKTTKSASKKTK